MFERTGALAIALYLACAATVVSLGYAFFRHYRVPGATGLDVVQVETEQRPAKRPAKAAPPPGTVYNTAILARANDQLKQLQLTLERTTKLLENRTAALNQKKAECQALQKELDDSIAFALSLLSDELDQSDGKTPELTSRTRVQQELLNLREELAGATDLERDYLNQLDELSMQLMETDMELSELRAEAELALTGAEANMRAVEQAAATALIRIGADSVPLLIDLLADDRDEVRRWAATVLGQIGGDARDAVDPLMGLLGDPSEDVRFEAASALARIR